MPNKKKNIGSLGQKKLSSLGITLPVLPLTTASSLPKHLELTELRYKVSKSVASALDLERREKLSTEGWLREQARLGMDVLSDGEMNRGDMVSFFTQRINGFERGGAVRIYGNRYYQKPVIRGKISWKEPLMSPLWQSTQRATQKPVKAVITGAYTLMDCSFNEYYKTREEALTDLTGVLRKEIVMLSEAGAKIIQIDEMSLGVRPDEMALYAASLKNITKDIRSYIILRHGYDDISSLWPAIESLPVDNFYFEAVHMSSALQNTIKKRSTAKDITWGVIDSHSHVVETTQDVEKRIKSALKFIPVSQLWLGTGSGLKTRTPEEATGKLAALSKASIKIRHNQ